jgi:hypothetical protein
MWIGVILKFRYLATVVVVAVLLIHAVGLLALGVFPRVRGLRALRFRTGVAGSDRPGIRIAESVDALLFSLVLIVLASGTASPLPPPRRSRDRFARAGLDESREHFGAQGPLVGSHPHGVVVATLTSIIPTWRIFIGGSSFFRRRFSSFP